MELFVYYLYNGLQVVYLPLQGDHLSLGSLAFRLDLRQVQTQLLAFFIHLEREQDTNIRYMT